MRRVAGFALAVIGIGLPLAYALFRLREWWVKETPAGE